MDDQLSTTFAALADPTRRAILSRLTTGAASVTELAQPFDMSLPAVTKHLKVLQRAGLISQSREAQWRPCKLQAKPMREAVEWMDELVDPLEKQRDRLQSLAARAVNKK